LLPRRKISRSSAGPDPALLRPPNLRTVGAVPVTRQDRDALGAWLAEGGWPPGVMDIATLEGYLVALLVWPVGLPAGAWLPPIWAERSGWRVPAKIASPDAYTKFIGLVIGFLQDLDRRLGARPPSFAPALSKSEPATRGRRLLAPGSPLAPARSLRRPVRRLRFRIPSEWESSRRSKGSGHPRRALRNLVHRGRRGPKAATNRRSLPSKSRASLRAPRRMTRASARGSERGRVPARVCH